MSEGRISRRKSATGSGHGSRLGSAGSVALTPPRSPAMNRVPSSQLIKQVCQSPDSISKIPIILSMLVCLHVRSRHLQIQPSGSGSTSRSLSVTSIPSETARKLALRLPERKYWSSLRRSQRKCLLKNGWATIMFVPLLDPRLADLVRRNSLAVYFVFSFHWTHEPTW